MFYKGHTQCRLKALDDEGRGQAIIATLGVIDKDNDITERGYGLSPFVVLKAKGADTMSPLGPWIVTPAELADTGAHCGQIMDASLPSYLLSYWVRERGLFVDGVLVVLEVYAVRRTHLAQHGT